jgi:hypothetical protein
MVKMSQPLFAIIPDGIKAFTVMRNNAVSVSTPWIIWKQ